MMTEEEISQALNLDRRWVHWYVEQGIRRLWRDRRLHNILTGRLDRSVKRDRAWRDRTESTREPEMAIWRRA